MIKGTTKTGFHYKIDEATLNDMELFEMISNAEDDPMITPKILTKILGTKQKEKLYNHIRTDAGNVPIEKVMEELEAIFETAQPVKK